MRNFFFQIGSHGTAIVELATVLPFLLILALTPLQLARIIQYHEGLSNISQEAANIAFRECGPRTFNLTICLNRVANRAHEIAAQQFPGADLSVVISLYEPDSINPLRTHVAGTEVAPDGCRWTHHCDSRLTLDTIDSMFNRPVYGLSQPTTLQEQQMIIVSEVFLRPSGINSLPFALSGEQELYEASIY